MGMQCIRMELQTVQRNGRHIMSARCVLAVLRTCSATGPASPLMSGRCMLVPRNEESSMPESPRVLRMATATRASCISISGTSSPSLYATLPVPSSNAESCAEPRPLLSNTTCAGYAAVW